MIKAIIFDLGNVLVYNHPERAAEKFSEPGGFSMDKTIKVMDEHKDYMSGNVSPEYFARQWIEYLHLGVSEDEFHAIYSDIFDVNEDTLDVVDALKENYSLLMLSNTEVVTIRHLRKKFPRVFAPFDRLFFSYELLCVKPDREIYEKTLDISGLRPEETVFIDDKIENIVGARNAGINAIQFLNAEQLRKDLEKYLE